MSSRRRRRRSLPSRTTTTETLTSRSRTCGADDATQPRSQVASSGRARALLADLFAGGGGDELLIHGTGIWLAIEHPDDPLPRLRGKPLVYCHPSLVNSTEGRLVLAREYPNLIGHLRYVTGGEQPPEDLVAIGTDAAVEHWTPGSTVQGAGPGKLGAPCTINGVAGILTAGHVTDGHATVTVGSTSANVKLEYHAGSNPTPLAVGPDYAVIELPPGQVRPTALTPRATPLIPSESLFRLGTPMSADVLAFAAFLRVQTRSGCWGEVYQLDGSIGTPGDSGSAVVDSNGQLVGHYLGQIGMMAVVQHIGYQLTELARSRTTIP